MKISSNYLKKTLKDKEMPDINVYQLDLNTVVRVIIDLLAF